MSLPRFWTRSVQSALVHVISLAKYALVYSRSWAADSSNARVRLRAKNDGFEQEIALLREEIRIKDARLASIAPVQRPHYAPTERLAILELRAARGWSLERTAKVFHLTAATIASWCRRLDEEGPDALLRLPVPVNKFPDFVQHTVQRLQTLCPRLGKVKIAQTLARAGLHLAVTTVGRMRRAKPKQTPPESLAPTRSEPRVRAKYPNHLWHADLTVVPSASGFWASWLPFALPQCWPFCWWLVCVMDHYSRRALACGIFPRQPTSEQVRRFFGQVIARVGKAPRHLVTDQGVQFTSVAFQQWARRHDIRQRFGAIGRYGSIAVIERFWLTLKQSIAALALVPLRRRAFKRELDLILHWYNADRAHMTLKGATPDEVYFGRRPACRQPRFEPRAAWPRASPCSKPRVLVKGHPGARLELSIDLSHGRHLPRVNVTRAA